MARGPRVQLLVDASSPLDEIDAELRAFREWTDADVAVILYGERAGWVPAGTAAMSGSATARGVGNGAQPALGDALSLASSANVPTHALVTLVVVEPRPGWTEPLAAITSSIRACVSMSREPAPAVGQGKLGAPFRREHLGLSLRWVAREIHDRTWRCACGALRVYPDDVRRVCPSCGSHAEVPPRLRIGDRVILLVPGARLYPHHVGGELAFDKPLAELDDVPRRDGAVTVAGMTGEVRTDAALGPAKRRKRFKPPPLRASGRCDACDGALVPPVLHSAPDPRQFCATCAGSATQCDYCEAPLASHGNWWPDGRKACRDCWSTATTDAAQLEELGEMVRAFLEHRLEMELPACPLHFEHAAAIARMHGRRFEPVAGFNPRPIGFFRKPLTEPAAIYIEHGMPRAHAYGVLAHELTHLWQWHNWARDRHPTLIEGLAMWVEYQALLDVGAIHAARNAERYGDPVYGLGFRIALAVERDVGFDQVKTRMQDVT